MRNARAVVALMTALVVPAVGSVAAQDDVDEPLALDPIPPDQVSGPIPVPDGDYVGTMGLGGRFSLSVGDLQVIWTGQAGGPIEFSVAESLLAGTWSMDGTASVDVRGLPIASVSAATWSTAGTITASGSGPYVIASNGGEGISSASVVVPGAGTQTRTEVFAIPAATGELDRVVEVCGQISATWDQQIEAGLSQLPGTTGTVRTYLSALPRGVSEIQERIDQILQQASELTADMSDVDLVIAKMFVLVADAEDLLESIEPADLPCDADGKFMRIVSLQIQDVMHTLLTSWDTLSESTLDSLFLLRRLLTAGVRAGAIGAGAVDATAAGLLESLAAGIAQDAFLEATTTDALDTDRITELATIGLLLGITFEAADGSTVEPADLCLALGGCA